LLGATNGFLSEIDVQTGELLYSTYLGGSGNDRVTRIVVAKDGDAVHFLNTLRFANHVKRQGDRQ
jgi:hypothetical protein